jgi:three-Cys-motif partner protein
LKFISRPDVSLPDDGFSVTAAEPWIKAKISIIQQYLTSYVGTIAGKADEIVFIDLFAGNGIYSLGARTDLFAATSLMALAQDLPVTKFILCDKEEDPLKSLKVRVNKYFRDKNVLLLNGRPEELPQKFDLYVPKRKRGYRVAVFCVVDPFSLDISFDTIAQLADQGFDFLIPFTFVLNDRLNDRYYLREAGDKLQRFVGGNTDIKRFGSEVYNNPSFYKKLVQVYESNMLAMGYNTSLSSHRLDSGLMELNSYQIGFFSRQFSTKAIQQNVEATLHVQFDLFQ